MFKIKQSHMLYILLLLFIFLMVCKLCSNNSFIEGFNNEQFISLYPNLDSLLKDYNIKNNATKEDIIAAASSECEKEKSVLRVEGTATYGYPPNSLKITVDGVDIEAKRGRGFCVVVIDQYDLTLKDTQVFDTHGDSTSGDRLRSFVEAVTIGDYVIFSVLDEGSGHFQPDSLSSIGVPVVSLKYRVSFVGIGRRGGKAVWEIAEGRDHSIKIAEMNVSRCTNDTLSAYAPIPSHFVSKTVVYRPSNSIHADIIGKTIALHSSKYNRFVRMNNDKMDASEKKNINQLPDGWKWELFKVVDAGNGEIAFHNASWNRFIRMRRSVNLMNSSNNLYPHDLPNGYTYERYKVIDVGNGEVALHNRVINRFISMNDRIMERSPVRDINAFDNGSNSEKFKIVIKEKVSELSPPVTNALNCYLKYCNHEQNSDLPTSFCDGNACTTMEHIDKCRQHWANYGKGEGRTGNPDNCLNETLGTAVESDTSTKKSIKFIRIEKKNNYLHMAEVQVIDKYGKNVAFNKPTKQSSEVWGGSSGRAVDNNTSGNYGESSVTHTNMHGWWQVDLGETDDIYKIIIYNRTDCCQERIDDSIITIRENDENNIIKTINYGKNKPIKEFIINNCYLKYCNHEQNSDLPTSFCGGNTCASMEHIDKCRHHWANYGKGEGRPGNPDDCLNSVKNESDTQENVFNTNELISGVKISKDDVDFISVDEIDNILQSRDTSEITYFYEIQLLNQFVLRHKSYDENQDGDLESNEILDDNIDKNMAMEKFFDIMKEKNPIINVSYIDDININGFQDLTSIDSNKNKTDNYEEYNPMLDNLSEEEIDDYINSENKDSIQFINALKKKHVNNKQNIREQALQDIFKNNSYDNCDPKKGLPCPMNTPPYGFSWN